MNNDSKVSALNEAATILTRVRDTFSNKKVICKECGQEHFANWQERQAREYLNGAISRIDKVLERFLEKTRTK